MDEVRRAIREAEFLQLPLEDSVIHQEPTRSPLERRFLALCRGYRLPKPAINVMVGAYEVDFLWRDGKLVAEVDGYRSHGTRSAFESDRARDAELSALGYRVVRFTYRQVVHERDRVAHTLRRLLA